MRIGPEAPEAASCSSAAIACSAFEADDCGCCDQTGCTAAASSSDRAASCGCGETPSSGPVWTEVRQDIPSPPSRAPHLTDVPTDWATGAVVVPPVALTVRFCAFLI